ncbi:MAG: glycosyltransferase [Phycisphaerae bacterium]|nr:glycosyltransferase [Phycisphaerae bacterium]
MDDRTSLTAALQEGFARVRDTLDRGGPLTVVFANDVGFIGGAGMALRRQSQSFLLAGHRVAIVCCLEQPSAPPNPQGTDLSAHWLGLHALPETTPAAMPDRESAARAIAERIAAFAPHIVITGNFHWTRWPIATFAALAARGIPSVAYLHDMHWISGRCVYAGACRKYSSGCDETCPTPAEYPAVAPQLIAPAWRERRNVFTELGIPLAANSEWMRDRAVEGFGGRAHVTLLPLALDTRRFAPIDKGLARRLLGLPSDRPIVLAGAIDMSDRRKGGHLLRSVVPIVRERSGAEFVAFGHNSQYVPNVRGLGYIDDERLMPVALSAADVFVNTSLEESFGQTLMEAAACGVPSVAIARGGVPDIARRDENALLVDEEEAQPLADATLRLLADAPLRARLGDAGRALVQRTFSLEAQAERWCAYLAAPLPVRLSPAL